MKPYSFTFFNKDEKKPCFFAHLLYGKKDKNYPVTLRINSSIDQVSHTPEITFFMTELQFIEFKNSILACDEQLVEERMKND